MSTLPTLPQGLSDEAFYKFTSRAREAIADALQSVAVQTLSSEETKLLTPALIATTLVLCGADYCASKGISLEQYVKDVLAAQVQAFSESYSK